MTKSKMRLMYLAVLLVVLVLFSSLAGRLQGRDVTGTEDNICRIVFDDNTIYVSDSSMALVDGSSVVLGKEGSYEVTGSSDDGRLTLETEDAGDVRITLKELSLVSRDGAPVQILKSGDVEMFCTGENTLADADVRASQEDPGACLYSKSDLKLIGDGTLNVTGNYRHGISVRGDLKVSTLSLNIQSQRNAVDVRDTVKIEGGNLDLAAKKDGIHAESSKDPMKGSISITGGVILIDAEDEGIQTQSELSITGGEVSIHSGGEPLKSAGQMSVDPAHVFVK